MTYRFYKVLITPLEYEGVYGTTIDVTQDIDITDFITQSGISNVRKQFDNGDYDVGIFVFGDITLQCFNSGGKFNDPHDARSIFKYKRDLAQIKVVHVAADGTETVMFEGLLNEDGTRIDVDRNIVRLKVLSFDSIFDQVEVAGGAVGTGVNYSVAIKQILNTTDITNVLNYDPSNINVDLDQAIDDGDFFTGKTVKSALDDLLFASNSILYIDANKNIIVSDRTESSSLFTLYGDGDPLGRENIIKIKEYNSGIQRAFSSVKINDSEVSDEAYVSDYGFRQKSESPGFLNTPSKEKEIGNRILDEFKVPRLECEVTTGAENLLGVELLDKVKIDHPLRVAPSNGQDNVPTVDTSVINETLMPKEFGSISISPEILWKVTAIEHNIKNFTTTLRLRQAGKVYGQGYF